MTDDEFLGYCELHCQTARALFSGVHLNRLIALAGAQDRFRQFQESEWLSAHEDPVLELVAAAQARRKKAAPPSLTLSLTELELYVLSKWAVLATESVMTTEDIRPALSLSEKVDRLLEQVGPKPEFHE